MSSFVPFRQIPSLSVAGMSLPKWLRARVSSRVLYVAGLILDALTDFSVAGIKARFPSTSQPDAIPYLARDRNLDRGPNEADAAIVSRITKAFDSWSTAGHPRELLTALVAYTSPNAPLVRTVTDLSVWDSLTGGVGGTWARTFGTAGGAGGWNWDGVTRWWRAWAAFYTPSWTAPSNLGSGKKLGDGRTLGSSAKRGEAQALRNIAAKWKPANVRVMNIMVAFTSTWFDPTQPAGGGINPDGTWHRYKSVAGVASRTRPAGVAFFEGVV